MAFRYVRLAAALLSILAVSTGAAEKSSREKVLGSATEWQDNYDQFKPEQDLLDVLKEKIGPGVKVDVYLGLWCPDSRNNVPPFIKIVDELKSPVTVGYYEVARKGGAGQKYYVDEFQVEKVPTFIVYREGKEIGRIVENPKTTILEDLIQILQ